VGWLCSTDGRDEDTCRILVENLEETTWGMRGLHYIQSKSMDWIQVAQDRV
jgi:hypothetical protein